MADREEVISHLQILHTWLTVNPRYGIAMSDADCRHAAQWVYDALMLLEGQEEKHDTIQVRCMDCKYWWGENELCMHKRHCEGNVCVHECNAEDYCSDGEAR